MTWAVERATAGTAVAEVATLTHNGREHTALGSVVDHDAGRVVAYVVRVGGSRDGREELQTFEGAKLGELRRTGERLRWCFGGSQRFRYYRATIDGRVYHGCLGRDSMLIRLRACKATSAAGSNGSRGGSERSSTRRALARTRRVTSSSPIRDVWLCVDCLFRCENGDLPADSTPERDAEIDAGLEALGGHASANWDSETGEGIRDFSWCGCDACGSRLGGEFHRYAILGPGCDLEHEDCAASEPLAGACNRSRLVIEEREEA